ncbi:uncharacterized protein LOC126419795 [Schistocerca serialis cubense]|uniref:uncharacterized protein LOC126419795 n=1 Tax=Schistocerca serialis cubense TaxID=2023355 RepID=UPI00214EA4B6|nr:uncharacterized protein LOC126419795 [Schistocerca serialis cubense]
MAPQLGSLVLVTVAAASAALGLSLQRADSSEAAALALHRPPPVGNAVHLRFRETPVWLACQMRDSPADRFVHHAAAADDDNDTSSLPDVVFRAFDTGTRYECRFEASEEQRAELRQREMLSIGVGIVMMKYEDEKWFSGDLPPFDCTTRRSALPRWLFDLEVRRPPAAEAEAALCAWKRHYPRGWRGLDALAPLAVDFPDLPTVACAMAPPGDFSAGTVAFTLPGLADPPFVCVFRTYRDFPGLVETQLQRQLDDLQRRLRASQEPQGNHAVRCERAGNGEPSSLSSKAKRVTFVVRAAGGYTARCRFRVSKDAFSK